MLEIIKNKDKIQKSNQILNSIKNLNRWPSCKKSEIISEIIIKNWKTALILS